MASDDYEKRIADISNEDETTIRVRLKEWTD